MNSSLNHIFRTIWSEVLGAWIAVSEITKAKGKRSGSSHVRAIRPTGPDSVSGNRNGGRLKPVVFAIACCFAFNVQANPMGGEVVSGQVGFNATGNTLTVTNTPGAIINWQGFSINANEVTHFAQQSAASAVLNRVVTNNPSVILGTLSSNGQVFLVNPGGIVFGAGSTVDVAGLVATSLNLSDADFLAGRHNFTSQPGAQNISNAGDISAQQGGQIYLIAPNVENTGVITAPNGEILLAAGHEVQLVNSLDPGLRVSITAPAGDATNLGKLIVESGSLGLFGTVVKNTGTASADSVVIQGGRIVFKSTQRADAGGTISASGNGGGEIKILSDMQTGTVNVTGTLDASAPIGGNGGFIETSAAHVQVADTARVTTTALNGNFGTWLIDPTDYTVSAVDPANGNSWMSNTVLGTSLNGGNVLIQTSATGGGFGDIFINNAVTWTSATQLTLNAHRNININANIDGSTAGSLALVYGQSAIAAGNTSGYSLNNGAQVNLPAGLNFSTLLGSDGVATNYTVITSLGVATDSTGGAATLQGMAATANLAGNYVLGANVDASATSTWNTSTGFTPIGISATKFTGIFDGLGHTVSNLNINRVASSHQGLFGWVGAGGAVSNVGLINPVIASGWTFGALAGQNDGTISSSYVSGGSITGVEATGAWDIGGLVGFNTGVISNSYVSGGSVSANIGTTAGKFEIGGLVGYNSGSISNSYVSSGTVSASGSGMWSIGGLVGYNILGSTISNSSVISSSVSVNGSYVRQIGGLVGDNRGSIDGSFVDNSISGSVIVSGTSVSQIGGLAGYNTITISNSYVSGGSVSATVGGTGSVSSVGGLVGYSNGGISNSHVSGTNVSGSGGSWVGTIGGLVGYSWGSIDSSCVSNSIVTGSSSVGGWRAIAGVRSATVTLAAAR
jgi:filamentous hemagglutinin family protein